MPRIPRVIGCKSSGLRVGDLVSCMATVRLRPAFRSADRLAALRKGRQTQDSARRLASVFAEMDAEFSPPGRL